MKEGRMRHRALVTGVLALSSCALPRAVPSEGPASEGRGARFSIREGNASQGLSELLGGRASLRIGVGNWGRSLFFDLPIEEVRRDGVFVDVDGVVLSVTVRQPEFLSSSAQSTSFRDQFGNHVLVNVPLIPFLDTPSVTVTFPLPVEDRSSHYSFDLTPVGGPLVIEAIRGQYMQQDREGRVLSSLPLDDLYRLYGAEVRSILEGAEEVERLCNLPHKSLVQRVAVLSSSLPLAGCNEANPDTILVSLKAMEMLRKDPVAARIMGQHEAWHLYDRHLGYLSESEEFHSLFRRLRKDESNPLRAFEERSVYPSLMDGGHTSDHPRELWASFLNYITMVHGGIVQDRTIAGAKECADVIASLLSRVSDNGESLPIVRILRKATEVGL